jgi:GNAT superfamily N-acetyltransferase
MYWIGTHSQFERRKGNGNKMALKRLVSRGDKLGLIAYAGGEPIGWCAFGPRERYQRLATSRILEPVDEQAVWSVVCFFVAKGFRRSGISVELLRAAARQAKKQGARILEGYPVEPKKEPMPAAFAWTGLAAAFRTAGFVEVVRRSETRPIMRKRLR